MAVTNLLGLPIPQMSDTVGKTIPDLASAMQMIDEKLGGSRIVDHNLDVADPPNGYYVRWEDRWQVCWTFFTKTAVSLATLDGGMYRNTGGQLAWTYPTVFAANPSVAALHYASTSVQSLSLQTNGVYPHIVYLLAWNSESVSDTSVSVSAIAIGRWK